MHDDSIVRKPTQTIARFGQNVKAARLAIDWTQEDLAHKAGMTSVQISRVERGAAEVRLSTVVRLVRALEISADELLKGVPTPPASN